MIRDYGGGGVVFVPVAAQTFFFFPANQKQTNFSCQAKEQFFPYVAPFFCQFCEQTFYFFQFAEQSIFASLFAEQSFFFQKKTTAAPCIIWLTL